MQQNVPAKDDSIFCTPAYIIKQSAEQQSFYASSGESAKIQVKKKFCPRLRLSKSVDEECVREKRKTRKKKRNSKSKETLSSDDAENKVAKKITSIESDERMDQQKAHATTSHDSKMSSANPSKEDNPRSSQQIKPVSPAPSHQQSKPSSPCSQDANIQQQDKGGAHSHPQHDDSTSRHRKHHRHGHHQHSSGHRRHSRHHRKGQHHDRSGSREAHASSSQPGLEHPDRSGSREVHVNSSQPGRDHG